MSKPKGRRRPLQSEITSLLHTVEPAEADASARTDTPAADASVEGAAPLVSDIAPAPEPTSELGEEPTFPPLEGPSEDVAATAAATSALDDEQPAEALPSAEAAAPLDAEAEVTPFEGETFASEAEPDFDGPSNVITLEPPPADDMEVFLSGLIEALLFTSQKPLELKEIARSAGIDRPRAKELLERLTRQYAERGINIDEVAGGYVLRSSPRYAPQIQKFLSLRPVRLSRAQLETLAIVAYRQPVTKPEVDDIRGVDSGQVIKGLLERSLLKIVGKKDEPGRPSLYGTTNDFLDLLNLKSLSELPTLREYTELSEESRRKFAEETGEEAPEELPAKDETAAPSAAGDMPAATASSTTSVNGSEAVSGDTEPGSDESAEGERDSTEDDAASAAQQDESPVVEAASDDEEPEDDDEESEDDDDDDESDDDEDESEEDDDDDDESDDDDDDDESDDDDDEDESEDDEDDDDEE